MDSLTEVIPAQDRATLGAAFEQYHRDAVPSKTPKQFVGDIVRRIYTEICYANKQASHSMADAGRAFEQWVDRETHFEREMPGRDQEEYAKVRQAILYAVATRAAELFGAWNGNTYPQNSREDPRNLRTSLFPYLHSVPMLPLNASQLVIDARDNMAVQRLFKQLFNPPEINGIRNEGLITLQISKGEELFPIWRACVRNGIDESMIRFE